MSLLREVKWNVIGVLGKFVLWLWAKSTRITVRGEEAYLRLREEKRPVILLAWHGKIFLVPYFFRKRRIMPLVSPSEDGEIASRVMGRWGYKVLRGSSSHSIHRAWSLMKKELEKGGELIIVPDGPRGPDRRMKPGALKLAQETGAHLVPFSFTSSRKKILRSWDRFLIPLPFSKIAAVFGKPFTVPPDVEGEAFERLLRRTESDLREFDAETDGLLVASPRSLS